MRTLELDTLEKRVISINEENFERGEDVISAFEFNGMSIHNPYMSDCGRFKVEPVNTYGGVYTQWYLNLQNIKISI